MTQGDMSCYGIVHYLYHKKLLQLEKRRKSFTVQCLLKNPLLNHILESKLKWTKNLSLFF
ncbi:hypothetical protein BpHYR1_039060 [Brachionus plicatilis]|uniref:Uncharacterized protein n=1 Tax=Brachionus plicatilis TaxID=10195 RepID=A0A3M7S339_BRAPC|nr:hypothetical protein BpHYR1_039060 [Brachionus plicatilis]